MRLFKYHRVHSTGNVWWGDFISSSEAGFGVLGSRIQSLNEALDLSKLMQLGCFFCMCTERVLRFSLLSEAGIG